MEYSQQFFARQVDPMLGVYSQPHYQAPLSGYQEEGYQQGTETLQDPDIVSTLPMSRPVIPSLEEAAEADDTSTRPRLTQEQIAVLEDNFKSKPKPGTDFKKQLASRIGLSLQRVNNWYQNRRAKARHQRPQERRFDVLPNDPSALWSSVDLAYSDYTNDMLDLSPQDSLPSAHPSAVDGICIPNSEDGPDPTSNFNAELDMFHGYLNSVATDSDLSPDGSMPSSLPFSDANNLATAKMEAAELPAWSLQDWVADNHTGPQFTEDGLAALQATQSAFSQAMYQSSSEGYHIGNPSCQTFATAASSSDGEQPSLMTPPLRTSPLPSSCQDPFARRESVTADLASDFNTIHLKQSHSSMGFSNGQTDASMVTAPCTPDGTPPAPPQLQIHADMTHSESLADPLIGGPTVPRLDIASRRKRPRPAALRPEAQRSVSYGPMTLSPTARMSTLGIGKTASVRRIKSTGNGLNAGNGRIRKPGMGSTPMSPRNFHQLSSNDFLASNGHVTNASSQSVTPLTPLSPISVEQQTQAWLAHWAHGQDYATPTASDPEAHITSPPITPYETMFQQSFPHAGHPTSYHWPPQSAPPQQTTFLDSPPMAPTTFNHLSWQVPSTVCPQGQCEEPTQQIIRPPMMPQYGFLDLQPRPSQHQQIYQQMGFYQPPFLESSPPQKEIEIQVQVIPAPEGLPQGRKTYTFNHTTPRDFCNAEGTATKVAGTTDPNPI
ncbi:MAG: hypothetical protein Q9170_003385 [Blastenia crenularia]